MTGRIEVKPGQVWADNDQRSKGRTVHVLRLETHVDPFSHKKVTRAVCHVLTIEGGRSAERNGKLPVTRINVERMRPTASGYALISQAGA